MGSRIGGAGEEGTQVGRHLSTRGPELVEVGGGGWRVEVLWKDRNKRGAAGRREAKRSHAFPPPPRIHDFFEPLSPVKPG